MSLAQLLRSLLQQHASQALREQIERVTKNSSTSPNRSGEQSQQSSTQSTAPRAEVGPAVPFAPCDIGIVAALELEINYFQDKLGNKQRLQGEGFSACIGELGTKTVSVVCGGVGQESARRATEALIAGHNPRWVISAGFAGGLISAIARHDLVLANAIVNKNNEQLTINVHGSPAAPNGSKIHLGKLVTVEKIVKTPGEKRKLAEETGALAVDMESFAVATVCQAQHQKFLSVRVISDPVDEELPDDIASMIELKSTGSKVGRAIGNIFRRPSAIKDMWRLKENAVVSADRLAKFLTTLVEQLP
jgi:adenosylhomocysteine nucleosidase